MVLLRHCHAPAGEQRPTLPVATRSLTRKPCLLQDSELRPKEKQETCLGSLMESELSWRYCGPWGPREA